MPLILLGLILLIGLLAFSIVKYKNSGDYPDGSERSSGAMPHRANREDKTASHAGNKDAEAGNYDEESDDETIYARGYVDSDSLRGDVDHIIRNIKDDITRKATEKGLTPSNINNKINETLSRVNKPADTEDNTIIFPTDNVEEEKSRRNIH